MFFFRLSKRKPSHIFKLMLEVDRQKHLLLKKFLLWS